MTNNMRRGFTMIELVFVIVIIGILAAVALPRFTGIADDAHASKLEAFTGTLNKTVGPTMWSSVLRKFPDANGELNSSAVTEERYQKIFDPEGVSSVASASRDDAQVESIPSEFGVHVMDLSGTNCDVDPLAADLTSEVTGANAIATATVGNTTYELTCSQGSLSHAPHFYLHDGTNIVTK